MLLTLFIHSLARSTTTLSLSFGLSSLLSWGLLGLIVSYVEWFQATSQSIVISGVWLCVTRTHTHTHACVCVSLFREEWKARWPKTMTLQHGRYCSHCCRALVWFVQSDRAQSRLLFSQCWQTVFRGCVVFVQVDKMRESTFSVETF